MSHSLTSPQIFPSVCDNCAGSPSLLLSADIFTSCYTESRKHQIALSSTPSHKHLPTYMHLHFSSHSLPPTVVKDMPLFLVDQSFPLVCWSLPTIYPVTSPSIPLLTMYVHMHVRVSPFPRRLHPSIPRSLHIFSLSLSFNMFKSLASSSASLSSYQSVSLLPIRGTMHEKCLDLLYAISLHTSKVTTTL